MVAQLEHLFIVWRKTGSYHGTVKGFFSEEPKLKTLLHVLWQLFWVSSH